MATLAVNQLNFLDGPSFKEADLKKLPESYRSKLSELIQKIFPLQSNSAIDFTIEQEKIFYHTDKGDLGVLEDNECTKNFKAAVKKAQIYFNRIYRQPSGTSSSRRMPFLSDFKEKCQRAQLKAIGGMRRSIYFEWEKFSFLKEEISFAAIMSSFSVSAEGPYQSLRKRVENTTTNVGIGALIAEAVLENLQWISASTSVFLGVVSSFCLSSSSLLMAISSVLKLKGCYHFSSQIDQYSKNEKLSESEKVKGALNFLLDQLLSEDEILDSLKGEPLKKFREKMQQHLEDKVQQLNQKIGYKGASEVLKNIHLILDKLESKSTEKEGILLAKELLELVQKEGSKRKGYYFSMAVISISYAVWYFLAVSIATGLLATPVGPATIAVLGAALGLYYFFTASYSAQDYIRHRIQVKDLENRVQYPFPLALRLAAGL